MHAVWFRDRRPNRYDLALGLVTGGLIALNGITGIGPGGVDLRGFDLVAALLVIAMTAAIIVRRRYPVPAAVVNLTSMLLWFYLGYFGRVVLVVPIIVCVTLTIVLGRWSGILAGLLTIAFGVATIRLIYTDQRAVDYSVTAVLLAMTSVAFGEAIRYYVAWRKAMTERVEQLERERDANATRLVNEERLRIAYEIHDVIAHSIASISVQAGVASHVIDRRPEKAKEALDAIKQASSEALRELRSVLGALRSEDTDPDDRHPAASLRRLPELTAMVEAAGLHTAVIVTGEPATLPAAVELAAYRIVQEALTNVVRHARASKVAIEVEYRPDAVTITVDDDGSGNSTNSGGAGSGLAGMRERARTLGGTLEAGPVAGGFRVSCRLPVVTP
jgi:signal transduction histidine kinase